MAVLLFAGSGAVQGGRMDDLWSAIQFEVNGTLVSTAAVTPVNLIPDSMIPSGMSVYITKWLLMVSGATAWSGGTGTIVKLTDTAAAAAVTFAVAGLTGNTMLVPGSGNTTLAALMLAMSGLGAGKGLQIVGDNNFGAGSDIKIDVCGYIK